MDILELGHWTYAAIVLVVALDSLVPPLVPSEALVMSAGALSGADQLSLPGVLAAAAAGALLGDVAVHSIGRSAHRRGLRRWVESPRALAAADHLRRHDVMWILVGRFVPVGRTMTAAMSGVARIPRRRYVPATVVGAAAWALYVTMLGRIGAGFTDNLLVSNGLGLLLSILVSVVVHGVARLSQLTKRSPSSCHGVITRRSSGPVDMAGSLPL